MPSQNTNAPQNHPENHGALLNSADKSRNNINCTNNEKNTQPPRTFKNTQNTETHSISLSRNKRKNISNEKLTKRNTNQKSKQKYSPILSQEKTQVENHPRHLS